MKALQLKELKGNETHFLISFETIAEQQLQTTKNQRRSQLLSNLELLFQAISNQFQAAFVLGCD